MLTIFLIVWAILLSLGMICLFAGMITEAIWGYDMEIFVSVCFWATCFIMALGLITFAIALIIITFA